MSGAPPIAQAPPFFGVPPPAPPRSFAPPVSPPKAELPPLALPTAPPRLAFGPDPAVLPSAGTNGPPLVGQPPLDRAQSIDARPSDRAEAIPAVAMNVPLAVAPAKPQSLPREGDRTSRRLAAEVKEHQRLRRNIITATIGVVLLLLLMTILMKIAG
ncbi:MAG TPA: hypothetical protein VG826_04855 [Pirellulales bacterium]|nr:hypothetical protein [Pirellulales bacterium]